MRRGLRRTHNWTAWALAAAVIAVIGSAYALRQDRSAAPPPERLAPPEAQTSQ